MRPIASLALFLACAAPAWSQNVLSEASGNWAGASGDGFTFFARLTQNEDMARLTIWSGNPGTPAVAEGEPQFDNPVIAIGAFATKQELEVLDTGDGSILQIVTEYADEEGTGRIVTQLQYLDNQFTLIGYSSSGETGGKQHDCDVDLWKMTATEDGKTRVLEPVGFEALNASYWTWDAPFERGFCHRGE
ncbi:MAG: hypothetical protein J0L76_07190 [Rhodobacterales bacterium]|nr:hypothetical protein [Rhodobacterales bacterium]